jgi:hypothetical protein
MCTRRTQSTYLWKCVCVSGMSLRRISSNTAAAAAEFGGFAALHAFISI